MEHRDQSLVFSARLGCLQLSMFCLTGLRLQNYRCFGDTGWIPLNKFSVFIGKNDGGKSSALHAIRQFLLGLPFEDADHQQLSVDEASTTVERASELVIGIRADVDGVPTEMRAYHQLGEETAFQVETDLVDNPVLNQDVSAMNLSTLRGLCVSLELEVVGRQTERQPFLDAIQAYKSSLPTTKGWAPLGRAERNAFPNCLTYDEATTHDPELAIRNFASGFFKTDLQEGIRLSTAGLRNQVESQINSRAEEIAGILRSQCDEVASVEIPLADDAFSELKIARIRVRKQDGTDVDWTRIGRGKKREMSLAVFRWQNSILAEHLQSEDSPRSVVVLFDEPDVNLDYQSQCKVTQSLETMSLAPSCQTIVATHSHNLINSVPIDSLTFFGSDISNPSQRIWTYKNESDDVEFERVFLQSLGINNSSFFNEKLFVCCSGETEIGVLPIIFNHISKRSLSMSGVLLINGFNDSGALEAAKILSKNKRRYVLIMDSDMKDDKVCGRGTLRHKHGLTVERVRYLGEKEFEDLFSDELWTHALNDLPQVEEEGRAPRLWMAHDILEMRSSPKFSEAVRSSAQEYSVEGGSKPKLGVRVARKAIEHEMIPSALDDVVRLILSLLVEE